MAHLLLAAPHKSAGKTTITLGLCAALRHRNLTVQPFKKGPDYIDPMWLTRASGQDCYNLDMHTMKRDEITSLFALHNARADISLIEGNMGLYDSLDIEGHGSNASLALQLQAPVVLIVDVRGATRSIVPLILGFQHFEPHIRIAGLLLNRVSGQRHEQRLREVIGHYCDIPILGALHRHNAIHIEERHLGLVPDSEANDATALIARVRQWVERHIDIDALLTIAASAPAIMPTQMEKSPPPSDKAPVRIGYARDAAFGFYYPDDLSALRTAGAELIPFDTLRDTALPAVDALFIGGGFPEMQMEALEANHALRMAIRAALEAGMPCYAECGGLIYLCRSITWRGQSHTMVGTIPADIIMHETPQGRGYVHLRERSEHPWSQSQTNTLITAHEFHYSTMENIAPEQTFAYDILRGQGIDGQHDGIVYKNLLASYLHQRDVGGNGWTGRFIHFIRARCDSPTLIETYRDI